MTASLKSYLRKHFWLRHFTLSAHRLVICAREAITGINEPHADRDARRYAETVIGYYTRFGEVSRFHGRVAEVGPGSSCESARVLIENGASHVDLVDRFFDGDGTAHNIVRHVASAEKFFRTHKGYDFILSTAVLEHLHDPIEALSGMCMSMNAGGTMVHLIDLRDHDQFSPPLHALSFLRLPDWLYWPLRIQGGPNRLRTSHYQERLLSLPLAFHIYVTSLAGVPGDMLTSRIAFSNLPPSICEQSREYVNRVRQALAPSFRRLEDRDLMVTGIALVAKKLAH